MAQFRVEFLLDPATGKFIAEMYHPDRQDELLVRTEPVYSSPEAAVLGVVQLFKNAIPEAPQKKTKPKKKKAKNKKPKLARKTAKKAVKRSAKRPSAGRRSRQTRRRRPSAR